MLVQTSNENSLCIRFNVNQSSLHRRERPHTGLQGTGSRGLTCRARRRQRIVSVCASEPQQGWLWQSLAASSTKSRLREQGIRAKKSLGQNFLTDEAVLARIVRESGVAAGDRVLEVGPGTGNLTKHLLATGAHVVAVEKDTRLYQELRAGTQQDESAGRFALVNGDILRVRLGELMGRLADGSAWGEGGPGPLPEGGRCKIVTNLPYNITTDFLRAALPLGACVSELYVMVQHEAAVRLTGAKPGASDYRAINIRCQLYADSRMLFSIPRKAFFPAPNVDSALVRFDLRAPQDIPDLGRTPRQFFGLVNQAFSSRRKMLRNNLKGTYSTDSAERALREIGLRVDIRAQDLAASDFVALSRALGDSLSESPWESTRDDESDTAGDE